MIENLVDFQVTRRGGSDSVTTTEKGTPTLAIRSRKDSVELGAQRSSDTFQTSRHTLLQFGQDVASANVSQTTEWWASTLTDDCIERVKGFTVQAGLVVAAGGFRLMPGTGGTIARAMPTAVSDFSASLEMTVALLMPHGVMDVGRCLSGGRCA